MARSPRSAVRGRRPVVRGPSSVVRGTSDVARSTSHAAAPCPGRVPRPSRGRSLTMSARRIARSARSSSVRWAKAPRRTNSDARSAASLRRKKMRDSRTASSKVCSATVDPLAPSPIPLHRVPPVVRPVREVVARRGTEVCRAHLAEPLAHGYNHRNATPFTRICSVLSATIVNHTVSPDRPVRRIARLEARGQRQIAHEDRLLGAGPQPGPHGGARKFFPQTT